MHVIVGGRGAGKTVKLIYLSAKTGSTIVCSNQQMVKYIMEYARENHLDIPTPIVYGQFLDRSYRERYRGHPHPHDFMIDDMDLFLGQIVHEPISIFTITGGTIDLPKPEWLREEYLRELTGYEKFKNEILGDLDYLKEDK